MFKKLKHKKSLLFLVSSSVLSLSLVVISCSPTNTQQSEPIEIKVDDPITPPEIKPPVLIPPTENTDPSPSASADPENPQPVETTPTPNSPAENTEPSQPTPAPEPEPSPSEPAQPEPTPQLTPEPSEPDEPAQQTPTPEPNLEPTPEPTPQPKPVDTDTEPKDPVTVDNLVTVENNIKLENGVIGYDNSKNIELQNDESLAKNDLMIYSPGADKNATTGKSGLFTTQNGSMKGYSASGARIGSDPYSDPNYIKLDSEAKLPDYNPNNNTFKIANIQREEVIKKIALNPNVPTKVNSANNLIQNYNFWFNHTLSATRNSNAISNAETSDAAKAPQPIFLSESIHKDIHVEKMEATSDLYFNFDALKHLVENNEMGQNPEMFAWKLITLSDEIRLNKKVVTSDNLETDSSDLKLFSKLPADAQLIKFYNSENGVNNKAGELQLFVYLKTSSSEKVFEITLNKANSNLKNEKDYIKAINGRSISLFIEFGGYNDYDKANADRIHSSDEFNFNAPGGQTGGTAWIVDRIMNDDEIANPEAEQDTYSFVMATNKHVIDIASFMGAQVNSESGNAEFGILDRTVKNPSAKDNLMIQQQTSKSLNSGFTTFAWAHLTPEDSENYSDISEFSVHDIDNTAGGSRAEKSDYIHSNQKIKAYESNNPGKWNAVVNITPEDQLQANSKTMRADWSKSVPQWLRDTKTSFNESIIYAPTETIGHVDYNGEPQYAPSTVAGAFKREAQKNKWDSSYTINALGADVILMKMTFNKKDIQKNWPELWKVLQKPIAEQKKWFSNALDVKPRTDDRTNIFIAGYPTVNNVKGGDVILLYKAPQKTLTYSMNPTFAISGSGSAIQTYWEKFNEEVWNNRFLKYSSGEIFDNAVSLNISKYTSNSESGMLNATITSGTISISDGERVAPGNSGSMVIDANFNNFGILAAFQSTGASGTGRSQVMNFVNHDPYSRSNVLENQRFNLRLETETILKSKAIKTLTINS